MVKCADCGFLAIWHRSNRTFQEAEQNFREIGRVENVDGYLQDSTAWDLNYLPKCFMREQSLADDLALYHIETATDPNGRKGTVRFILSKERACASYTPWQQGFTPKEHREMIDRQRLLDWQAQREDADRKWREQQQTADLAWRERQEKRADERNKSQIFWVAVIATAALVVAQLGAAVIQILPWLLNKTTEFAD